MLRIDRFTFDQGRAYNKRASDAYRDHQLFVGIMEIDAGVIDRDLVFTTEFV